MLKLSTYERLIFISPTFALGASPFRPPEILPFPDLPEAAADLDPATAVEFMAAASSHVEAGLVDETVERLNAFADPSFAARLAISLGDQFGSRELLELAPELDDSADIRQQAGAGLTKILLASIAAEPESDEVPEQPSLPTADEQPTATLKQETEPELVTRLRRMRRPLTQAITSAITAYDVNQARIAYDTEVVEQVGTLVSAGLREEASELIRTLRTSYGTSEARKLYDATALPFIATAMQAGKLGHAGDLVTGMKTSYGLNEAKKLHDAEALKLIARLVELGRTGDIPKVVARLQTSYGSQQARQLLRNQKTN